MIRLAVQRRGILAMVAMTLALAMTLGFSATAQAASITSATWNDAGYVRVGVTEIPSAGCVLYRSGGGATDKKIATMNSSYYSDDSVGENTTYSYYVRPKVWQGSTLVEGEKSAVVSVTTGTKASSASDPDPDPDSGSTSDSSTVSVTQKCSVSYFSMFSKTPLKAVATINVGEGSYSQYGSTHTGSTYYVELLRNGKKVASKMGNEGQIVFEFDTAVSYAKKDTFVAKAYMVVDGTKYAGGTKTTSKQSCKLGKCKPKATKVSAKQAYVSWNKVDGATKYQVYLGSEVVKTVGASKTGYMVKKAGAGKATYKVIPLIQADGKTYKGKSGTAKPKANLKKFPKASINPKDYDWKTCKFVIRQVKLSGSTYAITGYAINSRIFTLQKYKTLDISITVGGKTVAHKKFKNLKVNAGNYKAKKMTLKIKGKAGADLANGDAHYKTSAKPVWPVD